jgi:hypothetical protein
VWTDPLRHRPDVVPEAVDPEEDTMLALLLAAVVVAFIAAVVVWGYPALIIGLLVAVALAFVVILAFTGDGLVSRKGGGSH